MMNILSVFWADAVTTGAHKRLLHLLRGLSERGHQVTLITKKGARIDPDGVPSVALQGGWLPSSKLDSVLSLQLHSLSTDTIQNTDVIVCFGLGSAIPGAFLKAKMHAKMLYALRAHPIKNIVSSSGVEEKIKEWKSRVYLPVALRSADHLTVQVDSHKEALARQYGLVESDISVVPNNIIGGLSSEQTADRARDILFVGTLNRRKGVDILLEAFAELRGEKEERHLHVAGDGPMRSTAERYVSQNGLDPHVTFHGFVSDVRRLMANCDAVVIPSRVDTFPNVALEAMSVGTPFVMSDLEELRSAFSGIAKYVPPESPTALADAIRSLHDPEEYVPLKRRLIKGRTRFDYDWVGRYETLLRRKVQEGRATHG